MKIKGVNGKNRSKLIKFSRISHIKPWRNWPALFVQCQYLELGHFCLPVLPVAKSAWRNWQAQNKQHLLADKQNVLAEHETLEYFGGETSKQGQAVETISCQANNLRQFTPSLKKPLYKKLRHSVLEKTIG